MDDLSVCADVQWLLKIREPRAGVMHEIVVRAFDSLPAALECAGKVTRLADRCQYGLMVNENGQEGAHFCAWPFFGDLLPLRALTMPQIVDSFAAAGISL